MPRSSVLAIGLLLLSNSLLADDAALWKEYGLVNTSTGSHGKTSWTASRFKDLTGALGAWEWQRPLDSRPCDLNGFCAANARETLIADDNYLLRFVGHPTSAEFHAISQVLPDKRDTSLPAILTFIPREGLVANSARYVLGPASLTAFAPQLSGANPGFDQGAEAQVAEYTVRNDPNRVRLALFYFPTSSLARLHSRDLKAVPGAQVKRSGVLVAAVFGAASQSAADTLLSRIQYEAKITWNDTPPPSPIKPLYRLLLNIMYLSILLSAICLMAGLIYAGMRIYRRKYGNLEADEAMTTLHLSGD